MEQAKTNTSDNQIKSIIKLIALHLIPGIIVTIIYIIALQLGISDELPKSIALSVAGFVGIGVGELGYLLYIAKKETNTFNIFKVLGLQAHMKIKQLIFWCIILFLGAGLLIGLCQPVTNFLLGEVFGFLPNWYLLVENMSNFSQGIIVLAIIVNFFFFTLIYPIIEELYFRGYLMARMKWLGVWAPVLNTVLFAVYHFWSPWMIIARIVAFLPLFYMVYRKDSLKLAISVHCLANFTDVIALFLLL